MGRNFKAYEFVMNKIFSKFWALVSTLINLVLFLNLVTERFLYVGTIKEITWGGGWKAKIGGSDNKLSNQERIYFLERQSWKCRGVWLKSHDRDGGSDKKYNINKIFVWPKIFDRQSNIWAGDLTWRESFFEFEIKFCWAGYKLAPKFIRSHFIVWWFCIRQTQ